MISELLHFTTTHTGHFLKPQSESRAGDTLLLFHSLRSCHVLSASLFSMCLSLLWIGALGPSILPIGELCVIVWVCASVRVHVALRALCWFCSAVSVTHWAGSVGVPWFPPCCVYSICLLPKNTLKSITPLSLSLYFSLSIYLPYLLLTSLHLSFQISFCVVVRWCACRQPALVSPSAGGGIEFLSQPSSEPSFHLRSKNTLFSWIDAFSSVVLISGIVRWETREEIE